MLTPELSKLAREELDISQRAAAQGAGVPRSYLNQFERKRWIPTDAFLLKLTDFYSQHGVFGMAEPEQRSVEQAPELEEASYGAESDDLGTDSIDTLAPEAGSLSGWHALGRAALAIGLVGGVLAATGNLPATLDVLKRLNSGRPRWPL